MILLDTNVMSELMKPSPDKAVERWFLLHEEDCAIASVAIAELAYGVAKLDAGARRSRLDGQIGEWRLHFADRSFLFTMPAALHYGLVMAAARKAGRPMSVPDAQIAAIALEHDHALATRNVRDFEGVGLMIHNPWD